VELRYGRIVSAAVGLAVATVLLVSHAKTRASVVTVVSVLQAVPAAADAGAWQSLGSPTTSVEAIVATDSGSLLVRGHDGTWQRTDDGGTTWLPITAPRGAGIGWVDAGDGQTLYANGADGLARSADGGLTWQVIHAPPIASYDISRGDAQVVFARQDQQVWRSPDGGRTWRALPPLQARCPGGLHADPIDTVRVVAVDACAALTGRDATNPDLYPLLSVNRSTPTGEVWSTFRLRGGLLGPLEFSRNTPGRVYATRAGWGYTTRETLERTDDDGAVWQTQSALPLFSMRDPDVLSFDPADQQFLPPMMLWPADAHALLVDPANPDQIYVGLGKATTGSSDSGSFGAVLASSDGGATWTDLGLHANGPVNALAQSPDGTMLYAGTPTGLWQH